MNREELLQSGLLEVYASGIATPQEIEQVEAALASDASIREAYEEIAQQIEHASLLFSKSVPSTLEDKIIAQLFDNQDTHEVPLTVEFGDQNTGIFGANQESQTNHTRVVSIEGDSLTQEELALNNRLGRRLAWTRYLAAASVLIAVASLLGNAVLYSRLQDSEIALANVQQTRLALEGNLNKASLEIKNSQESLAMMSDPNSMKVVMKGMNEGEGQKAAVIWNPKSKMLKLMMPDMPLAADKDLQLWAIVNGKPMDLGILPATGGMIDQMISELPTASAFAVTIEEKGGKPQPEGSMVLMGAIQI